jgi:hypothetical protein
MEAAIQAHGAAGPGDRRTSRQCVTERDLDHPFPPDNERRQCAHEVRPQSRTSMEIAIECASLGEHGGSGHGVFKWTAPSPETMSGVITMTMTQGAQTMTTHVTVTGRWLGADCGSVKPRQAED